MATNGLENLLKSIEEARSQSVPQGQTSNLNSLYKALVIPGVAFVTTALLKNFLSPLFTGLATVLISILMLVLLLYRQRVADATR